MIYYVVVVGVAAAMLLFGTKRGRDIVFAEDLDGRPATLGGGGANTGDRHDFDSVRGHTNEPPVTLPPNDFDFVAAREAIKGH